MAGLSALSCVVLIAPLIATATTGLAAPVEDAGAGLAVAQLTPSPTPTQTPIPSMTLTRVQDLLRQNRTRDALNEIEALLAASPNDPEYNFYAAFLRLLDIAETPDARLNELLSLFGVTAFDFVPDATWAAVTPLPESAPSLKEIQQYAAQRLLPVVQESITNMERVAAATTATLKVLDGLGADAAWFEVDAGDAMILEGGLYALQAMVHAINAFNVDIDANEVEAVIATPTLVPADLEALLRSHPTLGGGRETTGPDLRKALEAWHVASGKLRDGIRFTMAENDFQEDDLFWIGPEDGAHAINFLTMLDRILEGLISVTAGDFNTDGVVDTTDLTVLASLWHRPLR